MKQDIPIFVINLPRDTARRDTMISRFTPLGAALNFFDAIDGRALTPEQLKLYDGAKRRRYFGRDLMAGEIGCLLSHRAIFQKMISENIDYAVILEDDVVPEPDFMDAISAMPRAPIKWDVIRFLGSQKVRRRGCRQIAPLTGRYALGRLPTAPGGAHGYMVTKRAAAIMLRHMEKNWLPIDTLQGRTWQTGLETLVLTPSPLHIDESMPTTIGDTRLDKTIRLTGLERFIFRLNRALYRIEDTLGKRWTYWSKWPQDLINKHRQKILKT